jgi:VIT1/CCC1 family predicted Fe2+/Mn2+ transporter
VGETVAAILVLILVFLTSSWWATHTGVPPPSRTLAMVFFGLGAVLLLVTLLYALGLTGDR